MKKNLYQRLQIILMETQKLNTLHNKLVKILVETEDEIFKIKIPQLMKLCLKKPGLCGYEEWKKEYYQIRHELRDHCFNKIHEITEEKPNKILTLLDKYENLQKLSTQQTGCFNEYDRGYLAGEENVFDSIIEDLKELLKKE